MYLSASPQDDFRAAEIASQNADAAAQGSRASFRASEIVAENAAPAATKLPKMLLAGLGVFLAYNFLLKGKRK